MAIIPVSAGAYTLSDLNKLKLVDGKSAAILNMMSQRNGMIMDLRFSETNQPKSHLTTQIIKLPAAYQRAIGEGIPASKATTRQVEETCTIISTMSKVRMDLLKLHGDSWEFLVQEAKPYWESMSQKASQTLLYDSVATNKNGINGLASRYSSVTPTADNPQYRNVIDAGGTGSDNTSIWVIASGVGKIRGIFPKGGMAGINHNIQDQRQLEDDGTGTGNQVLVRTDQWDWMMGLAVENWSYVVRICNIDVSDLQTGTSTQASTASTNVVRCLLKAFGLFPELTGAVIYCNRDVKEALPRLAPEMSKGLIKYSESINEYGDVKPGYSRGSDLYFQGVPVRLEDQILNSETRVV